MLSPLIISLEEINPALPLLILATAAFIETILILPLPETKGTLLPETVNDLQFEFKEQSATIDNVYTIKTSEYTNGSE